MPDQSFTDGKRESGCMELNKNYFHSVTLDRDRCMGCTNCIKRCPTEAIRVKNGKAKIIKERCIDCGECIRVCPYHAKKAVTDPFDSIENFEYKIALPAPSFYGQFHAIDDINIILNGLKQIGFDDVFEVARAAEIVTIASIDMMYQNKLKPPIISSACPAVVRLIRVRFPNLIKHVLPILSPMDVAAKLAKQEAAEKTGLPPEKIGAFFLSPCAAKVTVMKDPIGQEKSEVDGVISMSDVYMKLAPIINKVKPVEDLVKAGLKGVGWANSGGEAFALGKDEYIAVDGIDNVIKVLEGLEDEQLTDIKFVEAGACVGGCVGGPLAVANGFVAETKIKRLTKNLTSYEMENHFPEIVLGDVLWSSPLEYTPIMKLDDDMIAAMQKMEQIEQITNRLPKLDCGSCGAPSCRALAEDIVRGFGSEMDCIYVLRDKIRGLTKEMVTLEENMPADETAERQNERTAITRQGE